MNQGYIGIMVKKVENLMGYLRACIISVKKGQCCVQGFQL